MKLSALDAYTMGKLAMSECTAWMKAALGFDVGSVSFFCGVEQPEMLRLTIDPYLRGKSVVVEAETYAKQSSLVGSLCQTLVLQIGEFGGVAQVIYSVVGLWFVTMVNIIRGPFAVDVQPRETVGFVLVSVNPYLDVAALIQATSNHSRKNVASATNAPSEYSGQRVVVQKLTQTFNGERYNCFSHVGLLTVGLVRAVSAFARFHGSPILAPNDLIYTMGKVA